MVLVANCDDPAPIMVKVASYDLEVYICIYINWIARSYTRLAQSVERTPFKRVVVGSSPTSGEREMERSLQKKRPSKIEAIEGPKID